MEPVSLVMAAVGKLLGTNAVGSLIGWVGGWLQRKQDLAMRKLELEESANQRAHELSLRRVDIELAEKEGAAKERVASIEAEGAVQSAQMAAMAASFGDQFKGDDWVTRFSRFIRPFATLYMLAASTAMTAVVLTLASSAGVLGRLTTEQWYSVMEYAVLWIFFHGSLTLGWWFSMRSGQPPKFGK